MKYEFHPSIRTKSSKLDSRDVEDRVLLDDLRNVANCNVSRSVTRAEYMAKGKYSPRTVEKRFGGWLSALEKAGLSSERTNRKLDRVQILEDLKRVGKNKDSLTISEYEANGKYSASAISHMFSNSWNKALQAAGLEIRKHNKLSNTDLFRNMEEVWIKLGRQPKYRDIELPLSQYSCGTYENRFGSFNKALDAFVKYINREEHTQIVEEKEIFLKAKTDETTNGRFQPHKTKRNINLRLRFIVMRRDKFKCTKCGRSPSLNTGTILHVDHIVPWSGLGETVIDNLQTLCSECNLGKSNLDDQNTEPRQDN